MQQIATAGGGSPDTPAGGGSVSRRFPATLRPAALLACAVLLSVVGHAVGTSWSPTAEVYLALLGVQVLLFLALGLLGPWPMLHAAGLFLLAPLGGLVAAPIAEVLGGEGQPWVVPAALAGAGLLALILVVYVAVSKRDFSRFGRPLTWALLGLLLLMLANALLFGGALPVLALDALAAAVLCGLLLRTASLALWYAGTGAVTSLGIASEAYTDLLALFFVLVYLLGQIGIT